MWKKGQVLHSSLEIFLYSQCEGLMRGERCSPRLFVFKKLSVLVCHPAALPINDIQKLESVKLKNTKNFSRLGPDLC